MKIFTKRNTLAQNLAFIALMSAINVIFILLNVFVPFITLFSSLILPFISVVVTICCKKKYYPIYFVTSLGLSLLVGFVNIIDVIYCLVPALITGFIFGILLERKINGFWMIMLGTIVHFTLSTLTAILINNIANINYFDTISTLLGLNDFEFKELVPLSFIFISSFAEIILTVFVIKEELKKFDIFISFNLTNLDKIIASICFLTSLLLTILFAFIYLPLAYVFLITFIINSSMVITIGLLEKRKVIYIPTIVSIFVSLMVFGAVYPHVKIDASLLLLGIYFLLGAIPSLIYFSFKYFKERSKCVKIK